MTAYIALPRRALSRRVAGIVGVALAVGTLAFTRPEGDLVAPGLAFRISASTKVYPGDTPRAQDDEVMRGRGVAVNNQSRIELLAYTPTPPDLTTDDFLFGLDSGKVVVEHVASKNYTPANDVFNGPGVVALSRVMAGSGRFAAAFAGAGGGDAAGGANGGRAGGGGRRGGGAPGGGFGGRVVDVEGAAVSAKAF